MKTGLKGSLVPFGEAKDGGDEDGERRPVGVCIRSGPRI